MSLIPTATLAHLLDLSDRQIRSLVSDGVLSQAKRGEFDLAASVRAYCIWARTSRPINQHATAGGATDSDNVPIEKLRAEKLRAEVKLLHIRISEGEARLIDRELIEDDAKKAAGIIDAELESYVHDMASIGGGMNEAGLFAALLKRKEVLIRRLKVALTPKLPPIKIMAEATIKKIEREVKNVR